jgi:[CysO sulfur-carrier protein]-S-L-cysteine hydrolase
MSGEAPSEELLPRALLEAMYRHARSSFPRECCGFVLGSGPSAELVECENWQDRYHAVDPETYPRTAETAYTFGGKDLRRLAESLDSDRPATIVYHSHPRVGAYFSAEDARAALAAGWPVDYLVVDCQADGVPEAVLFRKHPSRDEYVEVARYAGQSPPDAS